MAKKKKVKAEKKEVPHYSYNIGYESYVEVTRERDPEEEWDGEDTSTDWSFDGTIKPSTYGDYIAPFEVVEGQSYYAVYVIYSTADSFSKQTSGRCSHVQLYQTEQKAKDLCELIKKQDKEYHEAQRNNKPYDYGLDYLDELGNVKRVSCDWQGYFESISEVSYVSVKLEGLDLKSKIKKML